MLAKFAETKLHETSLTDLEYDKLIYSVKHNTYTVINTQMATCLSSSEPSSGQFLIYRHGAFSDYAQYGIPYCLQNIFILKFKLTDVSLKYILNYYT